MMKACCTDEQRHDDKASVIERVGRIIPNCATYMLKGRGHMKFLSEEEKKMIVDFLLEE